MWRNPDTGLSAGALDRAQQRLLEDDRTAVVGVRLVRPDGSFDHAAKRSFPTLLGALGEFSGLARRGPRAQYRAPLASASVRLSFGPASKSLAREIDAALAQGGIAQAVAGRVTRKAVTELLGSALARQLFDGDAEESGVPWRS